MGNSPRDCGPGGQWLGFIFIWWGTVLMGSCPRTGCITFQQVKAGVHLSADKIRKGCGSKLCHFGILSASDVEKCANHCSLCIGCRSVLGINPEGIKTVSGIFQEYAKRLLNECGFTKFGFRILSAP